MAQVQQTNQRFRMSINCKNSGFTGKASSLRPHAPSSRADLISRRLQVFHSSWVTADFISFLKCRSALWYDSERQTNCSLSSCGPVGSFGSALQLSNRDTDALEKCWCYALRRLRFRVAPEVTSGIKQLLALLGPGHWDHCCWSYRQRSAGKSWGRVEGREWRRRKGRQRRVCFFLLFPSRTNSGRHRPRSCDFEVVSLIKELIKEKLHASEQITWERKGTGREEKGTDMKQRSDIGSSSVSEVSVVLLIGREASWHTGDGCESWKRKPCHPHVWMILAASCGVIATKH